MGDGEKPCIFYSDSWQKVYTSITWKGTKSDFSLELHKYWHYVNSRNKSFANIFVNTFFLVKRKNIRILSTSTFLALRHTVYIFDCAVHGRKNDGWCTRKLSAELCSALFPKAVVYQNSFLVFIFHSSQAESQWLYVKSFALPSKIL